MIDFIPITEEGDHITSRLPAGDSIVEVTLKDGTVMRAWFDSNILEQGDFDFVPLGDDGEPAIDADSIAHNVVSWRYPAKEAQ